MTHTPINQSRIARACIAIAFLSFLSLGCQNSTASLATVVGSGKVKIESRDVAEFHKVKISGAVDATIVHGETMSVEISTDDNILPMVQTSVTKGGALLVRTAGGRNYDVQTPIQVKITMPVCDSIDVGGASTVAVNGFQQEELLSKCHGDSKLIVDSRIEHLDLIANGAADVHVDTFAVKTAAISLSGASQVAILANESIEGIAAGASNVTYRGNPKNVSIETSGVSNVRRDTEHASI